MSVPDLPTPVARVLSAIAAQDSDGFVAGFAIDGYVDDRAAPSAATSRSGAGATVS